jgi:Ca2+-binding RTX toxin-like protein
MSIITVTPPASGALTLNAAFFNTITSGSTIILKNGTYDAARITLPSHLNNITIRPETEGGVTFTGATRIDINGNHATLEGFTFKGTGADSVRIMGDNVTLEGNHFVGAGNVSSTQSTIVFVAPSAQDTHIVGNDFEGSISMSIKVRSGEFTSKDQPYNTVIENNNFHDIVRLSNNGQECIQVAGPGGGWYTGNDLELNTLIKGNIFNKTNGDVEVISMKVGGTHVTGNVFANMDAAPTVRNGGHNEITDNILINTRPIRIMGDHTEVTGNIIINPLKAAFILGNGTTGYEVAENNLIANNTIFSENSISVFKFSNQSSDTSSFAHDNLFQNNHVQVTANSKLFDFSNTGSSEAAYKATNGLFAQLSVDATTKALVTSIIAKSKDAGALLDDYILGDHNFAKSAPANIITNGDAGKNALTGTAHNDTLFGHGGTDTLQGQGGNDILVGGAGSDILTGGAGADIFRFLSRSDSEKAGKDRIMDFTQGEDKIDLTGLGFKGLTDIRVTDGLLKIEFNSNVGRTYVGDDHGFSFTINGNVALTHGDFIWG